MKNHEIRYIFEHRLLPNWYFQDKDGFIFAMLDKEDNLFNIAKSIYNQEKFPMPYNQNQYNVKAYKVIEDIHMVILTMPTPEEIPECYKMYLIFDDKFQRMNYFTVEKSLDNKTFLCGWDKNGNHHNYGELNTTDEDELFMCVVKLHMSEFYGYKD